MRRYQPTTLPDLAAGVVPDDDAVSAESESEEDEYAALMTAADLSAERLPGLPDGQRRRVVVVFDVGGSQMLAVHADTGDDASPEDDLAWYATQELDSLLDGIV
ncbi:hypothetical protein ISU10_01755 [Nocardioides agariphilus]|jgi:hypothetical protein|uniref:Uncharacterized protein n=1 Tax=Nocardioides agariphilus TaxID=433664 RepID=A0A930VFE4_9ACTN|nr:hypothetical protein [Nocardioides agariphilus]MBF4766489.1 hypothetical protein [Nocardioides agariphilus]